LDDLLAGIVKQERMTKNSPDDLLERQQRLWIGKAIDLLQQRGREDLIPQIGKPDMKAVVQNHINCRGAHPIGGDCACGWGHCIECKNWVPGSAGWGIRCNKARCTQSAPSNIPAPRAVIPAPDPKPPRPTTAVKTPRSQTKRAKGGLGGAGGGNTTDEEEEEEDDETSDLWQPMSKPTPKKRTPPTTGGKGKKVVTPLTAVGGPAIQPAAPAVPLAPAAPPAAAPAAPPPAAPAAPPPPAAPVMAAGGEAIDLTDVQPDEAVVPMAGAALPHGFPRHWPLPPPGTSPYQATLQELELNSMEAQSVIAYFRKCNQMSILLYAIGRGITYIDGDIIEDPTVFTVTKVTGIRDFPKQEAYHAFENGVMAKRGKSQEEVRETVFHGTCLSSALRIADEGFNRGKTGIKAHGDGSYHDVNGPLSLHHAREKRTPVDPACVIVSKIASGVIGQTRHGSVEPRPGCDCGADGPDRKAWMRVSFHDSQVCPEYILQLEKIGRE